MCICSQKAIKIKHVVISWKRAAHVTNRNIIWVWKDDERQTDRHARPLRLSNSHILPWSVRLKSHRVKAECVSCTHDLWRATTPPRPQQNKEREWAKHTDSLESSDINEPLTGLWKIKPMWGTGGFFHLFDMKQLMNIYISTSQYTHWLLCVWNSCFCSMSSVYCTQHVNFCPSFKMCVKYTI